MKAIPAQLLAHYAEECTTVCFLVHVQCKDGQVFGFTTLDADVTYDRGDGPVTYRASNGVAPMRMQTTADMAVDNTEIQGWYSDSGITEAQVRAGLLDFAKVRIYRVNYLDLAAGHEIWASGTLGQTRYTEHGWITEFRSLTQQLKQTISVLYSLTCRAKFGSKPIGTGGEQPEERYPCGKDWVWVEGAITAVDGTEPDRLFTDGSRAEATGHFVPGVVEITAGPNTGAQMEVDAFEAGGFTLALPLAYPLTPGTTYRVRQDCDKTFAMCKARFSNTLNFRGEHLIPIADGGANLVPGAQL